MQSFKKKAMGTKRLYEIAFVGLKMGEHSFEYDLNTAFFTDKGAEGIEEIEANVKLTLEKNVGFMLLKFATGGKAAVNCDRCGNILKIDLWDEFNVVVKLTDNADEANEEEEDPDIFYIERNESHLDVSDWLYEFVMLSIPTQNVCGNDAAGHSLCNEEVLNKLKEMAANTEIVKENNIWKGLDKFKQN